MAESPHGGDLVAGVLAQHGVTHLFTMAGGHHAPILDGCARAGIRIVDLRHQQAAVHAADGWARVTRTPGVAAVTAGPGVTNTVTAVAAADRAGSPLLLLAGRSPEAERGMGAFHELDQVALMARVAGWAETCTESALIAERTAAALRAAAGRGAAFLDVPVDVLGAPAAGGAAPSARSRGQGAADHSNIAGAADPATVARAAELMRGAERPVVLAGSGVYRGRAEQVLADIADAVGGPVVLTAMARGCLQPTHQSFVRAARGVALGDADVVLALGVEWDYRIGFGRTPFDQGARLVDVRGPGEERAPGRTVDVELRGDVRTVIGQLVEAGVSGGGTSAWVERIRDEDRRALEAARPGMASDASPIHPQRFAREIAEVMGEDDVVIGDGGDVVGITASIVHPHRPGGWLDPGPFASLGVGVPFAIAARLARPSSRVLGVFGDGSFGLSAMEFESAIRQGIPFVSVIGNDGAWGQVRVAQEALYGESVAATLSQETGYERMIEALGGYGQRVDDPRELRPALERAFDSGVPACVNVLLDPALMNRASYVS